MIIKSEQEMLEFGKNFADNFVKNNSDKPSVIELIGDVGAGKTTFTRGLAQGLGAKNEVTSPSFTISKSYALPNGKTLTHYDFYRLQDPGLMSEDLAENLIDQIRLSSSNGAILSPISSQTLELLLHSKRTTTILAK